MQSEPCTRSGLSRVQHECSRMQGPTRSEELRAYRRSQVSPAAVSGVSRSGCQAGMVWCCAVGVNDSVETRTADSATAALAVTKKGSDRTLMCGSYGKPWAGSLLWADAGED